MELICACYVITRKWLWRTSVFVDQCVVCFYITLFYQDRKPHTVSLKFTKVAWQPVCVCLVRSSRPNNIMDRFGEMLGAKQHELDSFLNESLVIIVMFTCACKHTFISRHNYRIKDVDTDNAVLYGQTSSPKLSVMKTL